MRHVRREMYQVSFRDNTASSDALNVTMSRDGRGQSGQDRERSELHDESEVRRYELQSSRMRERMRDIEERTFEGEYNSAIYTQTYETRMHANHVKLPFPIAHHSKS